MPSAELLNHLSLRTRTFLFFALIGAAVPLVVGGGLVLAAQRIDSEAMPHLVLFGGGAVLALLMLIGWVWLKFDENVAKPIQGLSREMQTLMHANADLTVEKDQARYLGPLGDTVYEISETLKQARRDTDQCVDKATSEIQSQKKRLEVLLHDLNEGVILCNRSHQVLLYNRRAVETLEVCGDVGLGRSLFSIVNRTPLVNALERLTNRLTSGRYATHPDYLSAPMVFSTRDGKRVLQGKMNLLLDENADTIITGYVLTFSDATTQLDQMAKSDALLRRTLEAFRGPLANLRTASETAQNLPDLDEKDRAGLMRILVEEARELSKRLDQLNEDYRATRTFHWPMSDVYSENMLSCVTRRYRDKPEIFCDMSGQASWLHCDSNTVIELIDHLINRIASAIDVDAFSLTTEQGNVRPYVNIAWTGECIEPSQLEAWLDQPLEGRLIHLTGRDILEHHRSDTWCESTGDGLARLRIPLLPAENAHVDSRSGAPPIRLEFYDFDLLNREEISGEMRERPLRDLSFVVFDTETTGLEPSAGDEIVSIAGVRIINNRVLTSERFDELVDPGRPIPQRSTMVHGISNEMVQGKPDITKVLPRFRDYASDSVLVAHNAAFDMRFLELKEEATGIVIDNPVLDTVLLSAIVHDHTDQHTLDAVAERFNIEIPAEVRHTALGDSLATAGVFTKIVDLLELNGITTLGQALDACDRILKIRKQQSKY